jgi:DNA (cytosine-5)-methyltransferase 1
MHSPEINDNAMLPHSAIETVELFCGIGGFRVAADHVGLKTVWANDLCDLASKVYRDRFGANELHEGDINALLDAVPPHDLLTGGFPCQPFSAAGKKEGTRDPRGTLFQSIVDVLKRRMPKHFVLENVKRLLTMEGGSHFATVLSALSSLGYSVEWRVLNAKHFGLAQNRERVFLLGTRIDSVDANLLDFAGDLRLTNLPDLAMGPRGLRSLLSQPSDWKRLEGRTANFPSWGVAMKGRFVGCDLPQFSAAQPAILLKEVLETAPSDDYDYTRQTLARLHKNEAVDRFVNGVEIISNQAGGARMGYTIFGIGGLAPTLTASTSRHYERYRIADRYRRLTPKEYARLQGFADDHCSAVDGYDRYMLLGNAVPPPMVAWVLRQIAHRLPTARQCIEIQQPELFDV